MRIVKNNGQEYNTIGGKSDFRSEHLLKDRLLLYAQGGYQGLPFRACLIYLDYRNKFAISDV